MINLVVFFTNFGVESFELSFGPAPKNNFFIPLGAGPKVTLVAGPDPGPPPMSPSRGPMNEDIW